MRTSATLAFASLITFSLPAFCQEKREPVNHAVYKVEFTIRDGSSATAKEGRRYTMLVESDGRSSLRVGNKVPYATGSFQSGQGGTGAVNTQFNYADIGVNIDCRLHEVNKRVSLSAEIEISSILHYDKAPGGAVPNPTVASARMNVTTELEPGKPTVVTTIDDPVTQRRLEIETSVTKVG